MNAECSCDSSCFYGWWLECYVQIARQCLGLPCFVRVKLASFLLWLAHCQVPKPQPNHSPQFQLQLQTPPVLKRAETYSGNFQRLSTQGCAPTRPVNPPPQSPPKSLLPTSFPADSTPSPALNPKGQRAAGRWSAACGRWAESQARHLSCCLWLLLSKIYLKTPPPSLEPRSALECRRVHLFAGHKHWRDTVRETWRTTLFDKSIVLLWLKVVYLHFKQRRLTRPLTCTNSSDFNTIKSSRGGNSYGNRWSKKSPDTSIS